jgi:hypothetical protein
MDEFRRQRLAQLLMDDGQDPFERAAFRNRQSVMPVDGREQGRITAVPERLASKFLHAVATLPQRAIESSERLRLTGQYDPGPIVEASLLATGPLGATRSAIGGGSVRPGAVLAERPVALESRSAGMYNPPAKPPRPFEQDYPVSRWPDGPPADASGRLLADIERRPLTAKYVVGRRTVGGADQALTPAEVDAVAEAITGNLPQGVAPSALGRRIVGKFVPAHDPATSENLSHILFDKTLLPVERNFVVAHEVGHGINRIAGQPAFGPKGTVFNIPQEGVVQQMRYVYNDLNNPTLAYRREYSPNVDPASSPSLRGYGPEQLGYPKAEVPGELMAETIRAYFADPNYIKTVAPKAAARAREFVNNHPQLSPIIQRYRTSGGPDCGRDAFPRTDAQAAIR